MEIEDGANVNQHEDQKLEENLQTKENKLETSFENQKQLEDKICIENDCTDDDIKVKDDEARENSKHVEKVDGMVSICLEENEYWEIQAKGDKGKNCEKSVNQEENVKLEEVIEEVDNESISDENYNSLTILSPSFKKPSVASEIRRLVLSKTDLKNIVLKYRNYAVWLFFILAGFTITLRMVNRLC